MAVMLNIANFTTLNQVRYVTVQVYFTMIKYLLEICDFVEIPCVWEVFFFFQCILV